MRSKETAATAAEALGKIADKAAVAALWRAYDGGISGAADALVAAGNRLQETGGKVAAGNLFKRLYLAGTSQSGATSQAAPEPVAVVQVRSAALMGWAVADHESAGPAIEGALKRPEPELQVAGVTAATAAYGKAASALPWHYCCRLSPLARRSMQCANSTPRKNSR